MRISPILFVPPIKSLSAFQNPSRTRKFPIIIEGNVTKKIRKIAYSLVQRDSFAFRFLKGRLVSVCSRFTRKKDGHDPGADHDRGFALPSVEAKGFKAKTPFSCSSRAKLVSDFQRDQLKLLFFSFHSTSTPNNLSCSTAGRKPG